MSGEELESFFEDVSHRLDDKYADERPHPPTPDELADTAKLKGAEMAEAEAAARKELMIRVSEGQVISTTLFMLDDDPHVQQFFCLNGHLLGAVTSFQNVIIFRCNKLAKCIVCGLAQEIPRYKPVGDEPSDLLWALAAAQSKKEQENGGTSQATD